MNPSNWQALSNPPTDHDLLPANPASGCLLYFSFLLAPKVALKKAETPFPTIAKWRWRGTCYIGRGQADERYLEWEEKGSSLNPPPPPLLSPAMDGGKCNRHRQGALDASCAQVGMLQSRKWWIPEPHDQIFCAWINAVLWVIVLLRIAVLCVIERNFPDSGIKASSATLWSIGAAQPQTLRTHGGSMENLLIWFAMNSCTSVFSGGWGRNDKKQVSIIPCSVCVCVCVLHSPSQNSTSVSGINCVSWSAYVFAMHNVFCFQNRYFQRNLLLLLGKGGKEWESSWGTGVRDQGTTWTTCS